MKEANGQVFNVGSGVATTVLDVAYSLVKSYQIDVPVKITGKFRLGDIRHNFASLEKINKLLGYVPKVDFKQGINNFTNWVLSQKIEKDNLDLSLTEMKEKGLLK
jgi:dTDP-L-rhamnose 4-epimerase